MGHWMSLSLTTNVHIALILANSFFGIGAIVGSLGLADSHPLAFLCIRQALAALILFAVSSIFPSSTIKGDNVTAKTLKPRTSIGKFFLHWKTFSLLGFTIFASQGGFLVGIQLAGAVAAAVWQPSQPIIMAAISILIGWEKFNSLRMIGVILACCGTLGMVIFSPSSSEDETEQSSERFLVWIGNLLFLINCLCDPSYVILSKRLFHVYSPILITAWSYVVSAIYMAISTVISLTIVTPDSTFSSWTTGSIIPPMAAVPALIWFGVFSSAGAYGLITWANQHASGTLVMSYTVLQPVSAVTLASILLLLGTPNCDKTHEATVKCLNPPNWGTFCGMFGVFCGLAIVIFTEPTKSKKSSTPFPEVPQNEHKHIEEYDV